jgi:hypothetical protein
VRLRRELNALIRDGYPYCGARTSNDNDFHGGSISLFTIVTFDSSVLAILAQPEIKYKRISSIVGIYSAQTTPTKRGESWHPT